jgi:hypothetical protein
MYQAKQLETYIQNHIDPNQALESSCDRRWEDISTKKIIKYLTKSFYKLNNNKKKKNHNSNTIRKKKKNK